MPSHSSLPALPLELQVFGVPMVTVQGRETRLPLKRAAALLVYLAFNAGPVPRAHLAALLWPDADEATGRTRLRRLVYTIEEAIGDRVITPDDDCLALVPQKVETDAIRFMGFARNAVASAALDEDALAEASRW